jgi:ornithine--oxo-acid transaminase
MITRLSKTNLPFRAFSTLTPRTNKDFVDLDNSKVCRNYGPAPVAIERGEGIHVWDVEGNRYMDFLAGYSACNQGLVYPNILIAMISQATKITLSSRAFHNTQLGQFGAYITNLLGYEKFIPMNAGCEADETACKMARRWAYRVKGVPDN